MAKKKAMEAPKDSKVMRALQYRVHPHLGWLTTASIGLSSFFIMITVLAQDMMAPPPGGTMMPPPPSGDMMQQPSGNYMPPPPSGDMMQPPPGGTQPYSGGYQPPPGGDQYSQPGMTQPGGYQQPGGMMPQPSGYQQPGMMQPGGYQQPGGMQPYPGGQMGTGQDCAPGTRCEGPGGCAPGTDCGTGQFGSGQQGQMGNWGQDQGQYGQGQMGQGEGYGPSEEQQQQMEKMREEVNTKRLQSMKKEAGKMTKVLTNVKKQATAYEKKGLPVSDDLKNAITTVEEAISQVKSAEDPEEIMGYLSDFQGSMEIIQQEMQRLPQLAQIPQMIKRAESDLKKAKNTLKTDETKVKRSKLDLSLYIEDLRSAIAQKESEINSIKESWKTNPDDAQEALNNFYSDLDSVWENDRIIQSALNLSRAKTDIARGIKDARNSVKALKRKKIDTTGLESIITQADSLNKEFVQILSTKPLDVEAAIETIEKLEETKQTFQETMQDLTGQNQYMPKMTQEPQFQMNVPQSFQFGGY